MNFIILIFLFSQHNINKAESLYTQVTFSEDPASAVRQMPVTVIEGMNHYQFASGGDEPPAFVAVKEGGGGLGAYIDSFIDHVCCVCAYFDFKWIYM
jgi:hypothetical protein